MGSIWPRKAKGTEKFGRHNVTKSKFIINKLVPLVVELQRRCSSATGMGGCASAQRHWVTTINHGEGRGSVNHPPLAHLNYIFGPETLQGKAAVHLQAGARGQAGRAVARELRAERTAPNSAMNLCLAPETPAENNTPTAAPSPQPPPQPPPQPQTALPSSSESHDQSMPSQPSSGYLPGASTGSTANGTDADKDLDEAASMIQVAARSGLTIESTS